MTDIRQRNIVDFEARVRKEMSVCKHFRGIQNDPCEAGVNIRETVGGPDFGWGTRLPCLPWKGNKAETECDKKELPTREEAEDEVRRQHNSIENHMKAVGAAHRDAKEKGYGVGHSGRGEVDCPCCGVGRIAYSVASVNGHLWGRCSTRDCVAWME